MFSILISQPSIHEWRHNCLNVKRHVKMLSYPIGWRLIESITGCVSIDKEIHSGCPEFACTMTRLAESWTNANSGKERWISLWRCQLLHLSDRCLISFLYFSAIFWSRLKQCSASIIFSPYVHKTSKIVLFLRFLPSFY